MFDLICSECLSLIGSISKEPEDGATVLCMSCKNEETSDDSEDEEIEEEVEEDKGA